MFLGTRPEGLSEILRETIDEYAAILVHAVCVRSLDEREQLSTSAGARPCHEKPISHPLGGELGYPCERHNASHQH
eukprot:6612763-Prymnesium_polylepis.2